MGSISLSLLLLVLPFLHYIHKVKSNDQIIQLKLYFQEKEIYTSVLLGSNDFMLQLYIDLDSKYTIMYSDASYNNHRSNTICNWKTLIEYNNNIMGYETKDKFIITPD